jgi:hypothetical protein
MLSGSNPLVPDLRSIAGPSSLTARDLARVWTNPFEFPRISPDRDRKFDISGASKSRRPQSTLIAYATGQIDLGAHNAAGRRIRVSRHRGLNC